MIEARNLTKHFGEKVAVNSLDLSIERGEIYGFLGPNGAGKTTTIRMLTGSLTPSEGTIKIMGENLREREIEIKKNIGVVPEEVNIYKNLKGVEFIDFILDIYGVSRKETMNRMNELKEVFNIDYLDGYIGDYSHGMKQKLMVASVLMRKPAVIFLDEPTVGLDARAAKILKMLLQKYTKEGSTIFLSTHILEIAEKMCNRIGIINEGDLIAEGTLEEIRSMSEEGHRTLEDLFLELTGSEEFEDIIREL